MISIVGILKNSLKFSTVQAITMLLGAPVTLYVATILTPEEYGTFGFLKLWLMYATLIGPGIISAGTREIPVLLGKDKQEEALKIQNISMSSEMLYTIIPFVVILGASFFYSNPIIKWGLVIIAMTHIASHLATFWSSINLIREKFNIVVKGNLVTAVLTPVAILAGINWVGVYALLLAPLIANGATWIYYLRKGRLGYHFSFDRNETIRLMTVGVALQGLTLAFWAFRLADRTIIAATLPLEQLGLYAYAMSFLNFTRVLPSDFGSVLKPIFWREASKAKSIFEGFKDTKRITIYFALGTAIIIPLAQLAYYLAINLITIKYLASIPIFFVLSYNLYLASMATMPSLILNSSIVNRQNTTLCCYSIGLALNIIFDLLAIKLGYGVVGVAWVTICTQGLVTFALFRSIKNYIFSDTKEFLGFLPRILSPFLLIIPFYFFHNYLNTVTSNLWSFTGISLAAQAVLWSLVLGIFYRDYLSIDKIKAMAKEINTMMQGRFGSK